LVRSGALSLKKEANFPNFQLKFTEIRENWTFFQDQSKMFDAERGFNWKANPILWIDCKNFNCRLTRYATLKNELFSIFQLVEPCIMRQM